MLDHLSKKNLIVIPKSPFLEAFQEFGKDELLAALLNIAGTAGIEHFSSFTDRTTAQKKNILTLAGPLIEKAGFFPLHFKDAYDTYTRTPVEERERVNTYVAGAFKKGGKNMLKDIAVHDPLYIAMMQGGLTYTPDVPAWVVALISFMFATATVALGDVGYDEWKYKGHKKEFKSLGFGLESYYESRLPLVRRVVAADILKEIKGEFGFGSIGEWRYNDIYFESTFPSYSGRDVKFRTRNRYRLDGMDSPVTTAQIVHTKAREVGKKKLSDHRIYASKKEKLHLRMPDDTFVSPYDITQAQTRDKVLAYLKEAEQGRKISFKRMYVHAADKGLFTVDTMCDGTQMIEIKAYLDNLEFMNKMTDYSLTHFPTKQTTRGKSDLF